MIAGETVSYLHHDRLGSVIAQTNSSGAVIEKYVYSPFGKTPSLPNCIFGYTSQIYDAETELYNYRRRYYSPEIGRFLQPDPIGYHGGDLNLYTYVNNSAPNFVDPLGLYMEFFPPPRPPVVEPEPGDPPTTTGDGGSKPGTGDSDGSPTIHMSDGEEGNTEDADKDKDKDKDKGTPPRRPHNPPNRPRRPPVRPPHRPPGGGKPGGKPGGGEPPPYTPPFNRDTYPDGWDWYQEWGNPENSD